MAYIVQSGWLSTGWRLWQKHDYPRDDFLCMPSAGLQGVRQMEARHADGVAMAPDLLAQAQAKLAEGIALTRDEFRALDLRPVTEAMHADFSTTLTAIWFGILVLIVVEVGLITPPVGMNLFIINAMDRETPMTATYRAVMWFVTSDIIRVAILVAFPSITLFLLR